MARDFDFEFVVPPRLQEPLTGWQEVAGDLPYAPHDRSELELRERHERVARMILGTVRAQDTLSASLLSSVDGQERIPAHQQTVEDYAGFALSAGEQAFAALLQKAIAFELGEQTKEQVITYVPVSPPAPKPWYKRVFGS